MAGHFTSVIALHLDSSRHQEWTSKFVLLNRALFCLIRYFEFRCSCLKWSCYQFVITVCASLNNLVFGSFAFANYVRVLIVPLVWEGWTDTRHQELKPLTQSNMNTYEQYIKYMWSMFRNQRHSRCGDCSSDALWTVVKLPCLSSAHY